MDNLNLRTSDDWTPARGVLRGLAWGTIAAAIMAAIADLLAWYAPYIAINGWLRVGASLLTMWLLFFVVHRAAGMAGPPCTVMVVVLTLLIAFSQHVVFALHGVPGQMGRVAGWQWCSPEIFLAANVWTGIGVVFGVSLWHDGVTMASLVNIFRMRMWR